MTALVLAEPEASVRGFLEKQLTSDGFDVLAFEDPSHLPRAAEPDVVVLGDPDALDRCRVGDCPVIVLGRAGAMERVRDGKSMQDCKWLIKNRCRCGEMADAQDLKSWDRKKSCGFKSRHRHQFRLSGGCVHRCQEG